MDDRMKSQSISREIFYRWEAEGGLSLFDSTWNRTWGKNRMMAMCKNTTTIFVYWETAPLRKQWISEHFQAAWEQMPFYLQVYDVTDNQQIDWKTSGKRIEVSSLSDNWYINDVEPARRYQIDFGTVTQHGQFFTILRSNIVTTPPQLLSQTDKPQVHFAPLYHTQSGGGEGQSAIGQNSSNQIFRQEPNPVDDLLQRFAEPFDGYQIVERQKGTT